MINKCKVVYNCAIEGKYCENVCFWKKRKDKKAIETICCSWSKNTSPFLLEYLLKLNNWNTNCCAVSDWIFLGCSDSDIAQVSVIFGLTFKIVTSFLNSLSAEMLVIPKFIVYMFCLLIRDCACICEYHKLHQIWIGFLHHNQMMNQHLKGFCQKAPAEKCFGFVFHLNSVLSLSVFLLVDRSCTMP